MQIRVTRRGNSSKRERILIQLLAFVLALVVIGIYLLIIGYDPLSVYIAMMQGAFLSSYNVQETIVRAIPILICALGVALAFRMNFWNIGGEGQILLGGFGAAYIALNYTYLPKPLLLILMCFTGMLAGGIWALIPGIFNVNLQTNETIVTLMMNYVAIKFITYLQYVAWKDPKAMGFPKIATFDKSAQLPELFGVNIGWILALVVTLFVYVFMRYTKKGYEAEVIGRSKETARYLKMPIKHAMLLSVFLSGAICGMAGFIQASAVSKTLSTAITADAGNIAIIVAWISGLNPVVMVIISVVFAGLLQGGTYIQIVAQIPAALAELIEATILFMIIGSHFFMTYRVHFEGKHKKVVHQETTHRQIGGEVNG